MNMHGHCGIHLEDTHCKSQMSAWLALSEELLTLGGLGFDHWFDSWRARDRSVANTCRAEVRSLVPLLEG